MYQMLRMDSWESHYILDISSLKMTFIWHRKNIRATSKFFIFKTPSPGEAQEHLHLKQSPLKGPFSWVWSRRVTS